MEMAKVTSKGQITIPISIRRKLEISEGDKILFLNKEDGVLMVNPDKVQGDISDYASDSPPLETADTTSGTAASTPWSASVKTATTQTPSAKPKTEVAPPLSKAEKHDETAAAASQKQASSDDGSYEHAEKSPDLNLSTLLDDLRSIGSI